MRIPFQILIGAGLALWVSPIRAQDRRITPIPVQRKEALIIGNSTYARAPLKNPVNDATAMEAMLRKLGFDEVRVVRNADLRSMTAAIDEFTSKLSQGALGFFYFSGHGVQVNSVNYLLPVDFAASSEADVKYLAYPASRVQDKMEESGARLRVLVLDACRTNPFRFKRDALGGLAPMEANAEGTLIAFATGDNNTADDNSAGANGLYTKYLIPALELPGLQLREAFQKAKEDVFAASHRGQNPSIYENIIGTYYLVAPPSGGGTPARLDPAAEAWGLIKDSQHPEDFDDFVKAFPASDLAAAARLRAAVLRRAFTPAPAPAEPVKVQRAALSTKVNPKDGLTYVWIPPGSFQMGCSPGDNECQFNEPGSHMARVNGGFWIGRTEVTQQAFQNVVGSNPSQHKGANLPVETVPRLQAERYCQAVGMRLPTEVEWEYAARAGDVSSRYGLLLAVGWYEGNSGGATHEVAQLRPNAFGLYDMLGNVSEWVEDCRFGGQGGSCSVGIMRGGAADMRSARVRASDRLELSPDFPTMTSGFRCAGN